MEKEKATAIWPKIVFGNTDHNHTYHLIIFPNLKVSKPIWCCPKLFALIIQLIMEIKNSKNLTPFYFSMVLTAVLWGGFGLLMKNSPYKFINNIALVVPIVMFFFTMIVQVISQRRFLKKIRFDKHSKKIMTTSVFRFIKREIDVDQIRKMEIIDSYGFKNKTSGFRNKNLVFRVKDNIQPLIFEIDNSAKLNAAEQFIDEITNANNNYSS